MIPDAQNARKSNRNPAIPAYVGHPTKVIESVPYCGRYLKQNYWFIYSSALYLVSLRSSGDRGHNVTCISSRDRKWLFYTIVLIKFRQQLRLCAIRRVCENCTTRSRMTPNKFKNDPDAYKHQNIILYSRTRMARRAQAGFSSLRFEFGTLTFVSPCARTVTI